MNPNLGNRVTHSRLKQALFVLLPPLILIGGGIGLDALTVARTGTCPPLDTVAAYPCSLTQYLSQELWKNEWLWPFVGVIGLLCSGTTLPILLALSVARQAPPPARTLADRGIIFGCLALSGCCLALLIAGMVSAIRPG